MTRTRLALGALISAAVLALAGCGSDAPSASWHGAAGSASGTGQGDGTLAHPIIDGTAQAAAGRPATSASAAPSSSASGAVLGSASPSSSASGSGSGSSSVSSDGIMRQTGGAEVSLTFDDGPDVDTPRLLSMLRQHKVKATFCVVGVKVQEFPQYVQEIVNDGHTLCNHTWKHDDRLGQKSAGVIRDDMRRTNEEIRKAVPDAKIAYFRHPGGNFTLAAVQVAKELGMVSIGWTVDPSDWNLRKWSGQQMTQHIIDNVRNNTKPGAIILSHDGGGDRTATLAAYKVLLPELKEKFTLIAMPD